MDKNSVLVLNVGTGGKDSKNYQEYINVLIKALENAAANEVVLVYSQKEISRQIVEKLENLLKGKYQIRSVQLPTLQMEFDADQCYVWFDNLLKQYADKHVVVDISHGTKAMSAALYAVGLHYNITSYQYAVKKADGNGGFVSGEENIKNFDASYAYWQGLLKQCRTLFSSRQYEAVKTIISDKKPPRKLKETVERCIMLSTFCAAIDRFDYKTAADNIVEFSIPELNYEYDEFVKNYLISLNRPMKEPDDENGEVLSDDDLKSNISKALDLMFDIYANGLRRLDNAQNEDAGIRAYRMAELLGQIHLMKAGYMSDHLSISDDKVMTFADRNGKSRVKDSDMLSPFSRKQVITFLDYLHYDPKIVSYLQTVESQIERRNKSVLIHGYSAKVDMPREVKDILDDLIKQTKYFISDEEFATKMRAAMFLNNNFRAGSDE